MPLCLRFFAGREEHLDHQRDDLCRDLAVTYNTIATVDGFYATISTLPPNPI